MIEGQHGAWITVQEAAQLAKRTKWTIHRWIEKGRVRAQPGPDGVQRVWGADVLTAESTVKRGRPRK
ncbi:hypothetical protein [Pseudoclavibacter helvolus]|uniref:hypothetical protein n=1 Tax=Pseudoclavibacter helvolus TaxID=255205 RepID=UPI003C77F824